MQAVKPDQVEAIAPVPWQPGVEDKSPTERYLTLTTCHPIGLNSLVARYIVNAKFDYWMPVGTTARRRSSSARPLPLPEGGS